MSTSRFLRRVKRATAPTLAGALALYFGAHLLSGAHGVARREVLVERVAATEAALSEARQRRAALEDIARRLHPSDPDWDYVEEVLRRDYGLARRDERIFMSVRTP